MTIDIRANLGSQRLAKETARHRHRYTRLLPAAIEDGDWRLSCACGHRQDVEATHRGRSSSRLGKDTERRIERQYGPRKVGEFGDAIDLLGKTWKWQAKATRSPVPRWVGKLDEWGPIDAKAWITDPIEHMEPLRRDLRPLLVRSWVRHGARTIDVIIVRSSDWAEEHGCPVPMGEFMAMTGEFFLDCNGRDEP